MVETPSRVCFDALQDAARAIGSPLAVGSACRLEDGRISVVNAHLHGISRYALQPTDLPAALLPDGAEVRRIDAAAIAAHPQRAIEWQLLAVDTRTLISASMPSGASPRRVWVALSTEIPLTPGVEASMTALARQAAEWLDAPEPEEQSIERLRGLERAAVLLPELLHAHDIPELFDVLSTAGLHAFEHEMITLGLFSDDLATITFYERAGDQSAATTMVAPAYPASITRTWEFDIIDDRTRYHLYERDRSPTRAGMRSTLRLPFTFNGRLIGGLAFHSRALKRFTSLDLAVASRLADYVAVALFHLTLAEEGRRAAAMRERAATLDLLDGLMTTIASVLDVRQVLDRISEISQQALPHGAIAIGMPSADNTRLTLYAATGALRGLPQPLEVPVPDPALVQPAWEFEVIDDMSQDSRYRELPSVRLGMRALLSVPVRIEEQFRGWVNFFSPTPARFTADDVPVARRIAAHVTLALSHHRLAEEAKRNEALRARTTNLELLDELLAALVDAGDIPEVFGRVSAIAAKVLPHDAAALMVRLPDGLHARLYASSGLKLPQPEPTVTAVPSELLANEDWEYTILDDLSKLDSHPAYQQLVHMGFVSLLRVPIRLEGRFAGALIFISRSKKGFAESDVLVARRMAERMAVTLARDRVIEASKRADEAAARASQLEARVQALTEELDARTGYRRVVGESKEWRQVLRQAAQVAATETTVLLLGESGTGKEVIARFLHRGSPRSAGPFIALNCAALPEQLLEAELFGYERGAYTGATQSKPGQLEQAAGGTLFLDEVAEMSPSAQAKFLRVLQEREFQRLGGTRVLRTDARVVAATNRDLLRAITNGQFREDLYYRLNVFAITLPPLRDRRDDVLPLSESFLAEIGRGLGRPPGGMSRDARQMLLDYHWPGNVRELRNVLERAAILCDGGLITPEHLALTIAPPAMARPITSPAVRDIVAAPHAPAGLASAADLASMERAMIEQALHNAKFNKSKAAKALGLTRHQLYIRMKKHGFDA